jgi:hypothetical protein
LQQVDPAFNTSPSGLGAWIRWGGEAERRGKSAKAQIGVEGVVAVPTGAPHPHPGLLIDLDTARTGDGDADHAIALLLGGTQLAIERDIEGFAAGGCKRDEAGSHPLSSVPSTAGCTRLHSIPG